METMKKIITNKIFILCFVIVLFAVVFVGFGSWYYLAQKTTEPETNLVPKTQTTESSNSIDRDVSDIDKEVQSANTEDFSDSQLNDSQVGL